MKLKELSEKTGISIPNLSVLKNRAKAIRFSTLDAVCEALDITPGQLLVRSSSGQASTESENTLLDAIRRVDRRNRCGGMVPIEAIRAEFPAADVDTELLELERRLLVDLMVANDPTTAPAGIDAPGRGRLCWVVERRKPG